METVVDLIVFTAMIISFGVVFGLAIAWWMSIVGRE